MCVYYTWSIWDLIYLRLWEFWSHTPEKQAFKDVCPIQNGDVALLCWFTGG